MQGRIVLIKVQLKENYILFMDSTRISHIAIFKKNFTTELVSKKMNEVNLNSNKPKQNIVEFTFLL